MNVQTFSKLYFPRLSRGGGIAPWAPYSSEPQEYYKRKKPGESMQAPKYNFVPGHQKGLGSPVFPLFFSFTLIQRVVRGGGGMWSHFPFPILIAIFIAFLCWVPVVSASKAGCRRPINCWLQTTNE